MAHFNPTLWSDLTPQAIAALAARDAVAVLPLAAIEQHGEHLPLSTDLDIVNGLLDAALALLSPAVAVVVMPPLAVGLSLEHSHFGGTLSLSSETALATLVELGDCVALAGLRRLVLVNSHGGNKAVVDLAALKLRARRQMLVVRANYFRFAPPPGMLPPDELRHGLHGGAIETAMMMHLMPHKVRMEALRDVRSLGHDMAASGLRLGPEGEAGFAWMAQDLHSSGVAGNALLASVELGEQLVGHYAAILAGLISEAQAFDLSRFDSLRGPGDHEAER